MLRAVFNINWNDRISNKQLYAGHQKLSKIIRTRRFKLAGHMFRDEKNPAHSLVTWKPKHGTAKLGRPTANFTDMLGPTVRFSARTREAHERSQKLALPVVP